MIGAALCCVLVWLAWGPFCDLLLSTNGTDEKTASEQEAWVKERYQLTDEQYRSRAWFDGDWKHRGVERKDGSLADRTSGYVWLLFGVAAFIVWGLGWRL